MTKPTFTIGMAQYADFNGVYFTIQSIRSYFPQLMNRVEFVVINNSPKHDSSKNLQSLIDRVQNSGTCRGARLIEMESPVGTSPSRNRIFQEATSDIVLAMDCHVLLQPGSLEALFEYYDRNPLSQDLIQGPIVFDMLTHGATHFSHDWGPDGMWGQWAMAWGCSCHHIDSSFYVSADQDQARYRILQTGETITECPVCGKTFPRIGFAGHEQVLVSRGYYALLSNDIVPYDIPGQGLGLFACRRLSWLGFHPDADGFGGEEMCVHEAFRQAGRRTLCMPQLKWLHRFFREGGTPYPATHWSKARNYVLWFQKLNLPLEDVRKAFVENGKWISAENWDVLVSDPVRHSKPPSSQQPRKQTLKGETLESLYERAHKTPRDLDFHMPKIRELASKCPRVTELTGRKESTLAIAAAKPEKFTSYSTEITAEVQAAYQLLTSDGTIVSASRLDPEMAEISETDMLFIDSEHTYDCLKKELQRYSKSVKRFIVRHDTVLYGSKGTDGQKGLMFALREFVTDHPQWFVVYHTTDQYGLTVLGCQDADRPAEPIPLFPPSHGGPGTELKRLLETLGIQPSEKCGCNMRSAQMDLWGVDGCRENFDKIVQWMRDGQSQWGWRDKLAAAARAVTTGLAFALDPFDPFPSLIREAINRAEKNS